MEVLSEWTQSSKKCYDVLWRLCGDLIISGSGAAEGTVPDILSPSLAASEFFSSIWPNIYPIEGLGVDMAMQTDMWTDMLVEEILAEN